MPGAIRRKVDNEMRDIKPSDLRLKIGVTLTTVRFPANAISKRLGKNARAAALQQHLSGARRILPWGAPLGIEAQRAGSSHRGAIFQAEVVVTPTLGIGDPTILKRFQATPCR